MDNLIKKVIDNYRKKSIKGGIVSKDVSKIMKENLPARIKEAYNFLSSIPKIPSGKKPIIAKTKEERQKMRKKWEEDNKQEMEKILIMKPNERQEYKKMKTDEYNEYMKRPEVIRQQEKERLEYGQKAQKMIEKAKRFNNLKKLIDDLKNRKQQIKDTANKFLDKDKVNKIIENYNNDMEKIQNYDFYNLENKELQDQLDKQYLKMWDNMNSRPKIYGYLPTNKQGYSKADKRYIKQVYENYGKPEPDLLMGVADMLEGFIGNIPVIGDIFKPVNAIVQKQIKKGDAPKDSEAVPEVDYTKGYEDVLNLDENIEKAKKADLEIIPLEEQQRQIEQAQKMLVANGRKIYKKLKNDLNNVLKDPLNNFTISKYLKTNKIVNYSDLKNYKNIYQLLPKKKDFVIILFRQDDKNNNHWICLSRNQDKKGNDYLIHFCSYGSKPDEYYYKWSNQHEMDKVGQYEPYLTKLLDTFKGDVYYNDFDYQRDDGETATCGRYVIMWLLMNQLNHNYNLNDFYKYMDRMKKKYKMNFDKLVSMVINDID